MDHTCTTQHMNIQHHTKNQKIIIENVKKIININLVKKGYQLAGPLITKTKTMTVLLGQDMEESYKNWIDWHTDIHPI